jgi:thiol-disulfide isomerase/thioredoxin
MRKIIDIITIIAVTAMLVTGCDIVEEPYLKPVDGGQDPDPHQHIRKVLLEEFTGQKCPNCPEAAIVADNLKTLYGEQLVVVAVHAGFYAMPSATGDFTADYRTASGNELNNYFGLVGYPSGLVNRTDYQGSEVLFKDSWEGAVEAQAALAPQADITIENIWNDNTRLLHCMLETTFLDDLEGVYNICLLITESGIVSPQQTSSGVKHDYVHNDHRARVRRSPPPRSRAGTRSPAVGSPRRRRP